MFPRVCFVRYVLDRGVRSLCRYWAVSSMRDINNLNNSKHKNRPESRIMFYLKKDCIQIIYHWKIIKLLSGTSLYIHCIFIAYSSHKTLNVYRQSDEKVYI